MFISSRHDNVSNEYLNKNWGKRLGNSQSFVPDYRFPPKVLG